MASPAPNSTASPAKGSARSIARGETLYKKAQEKEAKLREQRAKLPEACTFSPEVTAKAKARASAGKASERLYAAGTESAKRRDEAAKRAEEAARPTFKPELVAQVKKTKATPSPPPVPDRFSHLYKAGMEHKAAREEAAAAAKDEEATFMPKTTAMAKKVTARRSLYDAAYQREQTAKRAQEAAHRELADCTFAPATNNLKDKEAGDKSAETVDRASKLYDDAKKTQARRAEQAEASLALEKETCTFKPAITAKAARAKRTSTSPVHERLFKQGVEVRARHLAAAEENVFEKRECSFKPAISKASEAKAAHKRGASGAAAEPAFDRLYKESVMRNAAAKANEARAASTHDAATVAWDKMLRPETAAAPAVKAAAAPPAAPPAVFERLAKDSSTWVQRRSVAPDEARPDWELELRGEGAAAAGAGAGAGAGEALVVSGKATPPSPEAAARRDRAFKRLADDAAVRAATRREAADVTEGVVDMARVLRAPEAAKASPAKASASAVASAERLFKAELKGHAAADLEAAASQAQANLLRSCWEATLRTEKPVALCSVPVEAV